MTLTIKFFSPILVPKTQIHVARVTWPQMFPKVCQLLFCNNLGSVTALSAWDEFWGLGFESPSIKKILKLAWMLQILPNFKTPPTLRDLFLVPHLDKFIKVRNASDYMCLCDQIMWCETETINRVVFTLNPDVLNWPRGLGIGFQISNVTECCSREWGNDIALVITSPSLSS